MHIHGPEAWSELVDRGWGLRGRPAVQRYRRHREALLAQDTQRSDDARAELAALAQGVADDLASRRDELEVSRGVIVELVPAAIGGVAGAAFAGPVGGVAAAALGFAATQASKHLWGWFLDQLPLRSARKLLTRSVRAELALHQTLAPQLRTIWETPRHTG
jgi:hypothetical protein